ncbi:MAG: CZB domain-containing protein [Gemmatimonadetes bacterium]|nr:CZB domain-containing protein [Gemmatimonadota bacterium]
MTKEIEAALDAHARWKVRLKDAIRTKSADLDPSEVRKDDRCDFGKWLHGSGIPSSVKSSPQYQAAVRLHAAFHTAAADVVAKVKAGQSQAAEDSMKVGGSFSRASADLSAALSGWQGSL